MLHYLTVSCIHTGTLPADCFMHHLMWSSYRMVLIVPHTADNRSSKVLLSTYAVFTQVF